jgi:rhodanese-related sulfurtransferase
MNNLSRMHNLPRRLLLVAGLLAAGTATADTPGTLSCPIDAARAEAAIGTPAATATVPQVSTDGCLVGVKALKPGTRLYDLRGRAEYVEFHVPGAQHASLGDLVSMPRTDGGDFVVYDGGRVRADALQACRRLRSAGMKKARVLDGGIVAWAFAHDRSRALQLNRLADAELPALLADASTRTVVLAEPLRTAAPKPAGATAQRTVVLADAQTATTAIESRLATASTYYWIGTPERLRSLQADFVAMDRKREAGPAERSACAAL